MRPLRAWVLRPDFAIGTSAKAGSQSLIKFFDVSKIDRVWSNEVPSGLMRIGVVRNPVKRFWSLYANIQERKRSGKNFYKSLEGKAPRHVLQAFEANWLHDLHFHPQTVIGLKECDYVIRLEDCFWLPKANASQKNWDDGSLGVYNRIRSLYRDDWDMWVEAEGVHDTLLKEHSELFSRNG